MNDQAKEVLAELLLRWEELHDRGQDTPATELAKEHPELIAELERRITLLKKLAWLDKPLDDDHSGVDRPASLPQLPRTLAGRYRLDELIAEGGFAQVYRAYDRELDRNVAVKLPKPGRLRSTDEFLAEARRAARLKHDGIVPVHDVGNDGEICFIVEEYLEGGSLADRMAKGRISRQDALRWITEVADALEHAHLNGVIHRDLKPGNILIDQHGRAKLADFGIAQAADTIGQSVPSLGTLRYMAPEQLEGKSADARSDIYSLAVVLYEVVTGRIPYSSTEPNVLRRDILQGPIPTWERHLPTDLRPVCRKALRKSPQERQATATQFATDLRQSRSLISRNAKTIGAALVALVLVTTATVRNWTKAPVPDLDTGPQHSRDSAPPEEPTTSATVQEKPTEQAVATNPAPSLTDRPLIPLPPRDRVLVPPESVGYEKDCPFPAVKTRLTFECPKCKLKLFTHLLYPHLPHCPRDNSVMLELPSLENRQHWAGDNGVAFIYDKELKQWQEKVKEGSISHVFAETANTPFVVELSDPERKITVRLFEHHATHREGDGAWVFLRAGKWVSSLDNVPRLESK